MKNLKTLIFHFQFSDIPADTDPLEDAKGKN